MTPCSICRVAHVACAITTSKCILLSQSLDSLACIYSLRGCIQLNLCLPGQIDHGQKESTAGILEEWNEIVLNINNIII